MLVAASFRRTGALRCSALCLVLLSSGLASGAAPVALHGGDRVSDDQLFSYLSYPVEPGAWVRYRVVFANRSTVDKTIGFGSESVAGKPTLFIETYVRAEAVTGLPAESTVGIGTDAILKTYVHGSAFADIAHEYAEATSALKVGGFEYEVAPASQQTYSVLTGAASSLPRTGTIRSIEALDMRVGGQTVHATHVTISFAAAGLPVGGVALPYSLDVWQSPDVPLGTVAIKSGDRAVDWRMLAFGRSGYRSLFAKSLDDIRAAGNPAPSMP